MPMVAALKPRGYGIIVLITGEAVAKDPVSSAMHKRFHNLGRRLEVHIGYP